MIQGILMLLVLVIITILILAVLLRGILGPTKLDRLISVNAITTLGSVFILLLAFFNEDAGLVDIALVFMLCAFFGGLWILRVFASGSRSPELPEINSIEPDEQEESPDDRSDI